MIADNWYRPSTLVRWLLASDDPPHSDGSISRCTWMCRTRRTSTENSAADFYAGSSMALSCLMQDSKGHAKHSKHNNAPTPPNDPHRETTVSHSPYFG
eukprot:2396232-Amphidinium_carterae.1